MRRLGFAVICCFAWVSPLDAQEAIPRPGWVPDPTFDIVAPKHFGAEDVANMLVELPNRPRRAGQKVSTGPVFMFPPRPQYAEPLPTAGPEQYLTTPFGPVAGTLQRPQYVSGKRGKARHPRRTPLTW